MPKPGELLLPDTNGKWNTFVLAPVSLKTWIYIAFDGEITDREIKKAMRILELALDWAPPGVRIESAPLVGIAEPLDAAAPNASGADGAKREGE